VIVLSREAFDALEFDAACSGDHRSAAQEMTRLADTGMQSATMPRSEAYVRAGEQWLLADDPEAAVHGFLRALEDGGPSSVDPRAPLARALFMTGRTADAEALIRQLSDEAPRDARMCDLLAELLVERGDLAGALTWATAGVQLCLGTNPPPVRPGPASPGRAPGAAGDDATASGNRPAGENGAAAGAAAQRPRPSVPRPVGGGPGARPDDTELRLLLSLRFRIRNDLGLPEDEYDRLLDKLSLGRHRGGSR
jgi:hypothetical protein